MASVVILLLAGLGAFVAYDKNTPVQEVRVYELPEPVSRAELVDPVAQGKTVIVPSNQESQMLDDNASPLLSEECCPDDLSEIVALDDNQVYDFKSVSPEVIEEGRRLREWLEASALHQAKSDAHQDESKVLLQGLISTVQNLCATMTLEERADLFSTIESHIPDMSPESRQMISDMIYGKEYSSLTEEQILSDWDTWIFRMEDWSKRGETLFHESPNPPTLTHTH